MSGSTTFPWTGNKPISLHVISNLVRLREVWNHGANSLLYFLLISCSSSCHRSQISARAKPVSGRIHVGGLYTASLSDQSWGGVRCEGAEGRGGLLLGLQEPGMLIGKIVLIRPSSLRQWGHTGGRAVHSQILSANITDKIWSELCKTAQAQVDKEILCLQMP